MRASSYASRALASALLLVAADCPVAGQQESNSGFRQLLTETLTHGWRWSAYWNGRDSLRGYIPGRQVRLFIIRSGNEAMVCIPELGQAWEMLTPQPGRILPISATWGPTGEQCEGEVKRFRQRNWPLIHFEQLARMKERAGLSPEEARQLPMPTHHLSPDRSFSEEEYAWVLPELSPPEWPASPSDDELTDVHETVLREALKRWKPECGQGEALVPRFSPRDRGLFVYVDLGGTCEKGVVDIIRDPDDRLTLGTFTTGEFNLAWLLPRIRDILLQRIPIGR